MSCHRADAPGVTADEGVAIMTMTGLESDVATAYRNFATREARGNSPLYEQVCLLIADDADLVARISALPPAKRQPNLVLGAARYLGMDDCPDATAERDAHRATWADGGGEVGSGVEGALGQDALGQGGISGRKVEPSGDDERSRPVASGRDDEPGPDQMAAGARGFVEGLHQRWDDVVAVVMERMTQTNEVGRCATLRPFIVEFSHRVGGPIALVEVGCSAGLTLYPDLYAYRYEGRESAMQEVSPRGATGGGDVADRALAPRQTRRIGAGVGADAIENGTDLDSADESAPERRREIADDSVDENAVGGRRGEMDGELSHVHAARDVHSAPPVLRCEVESDKAWALVSGVDDGVRIAWRGGLDLNPLDVSASTDGAGDNARWLRALVWPGQEERAARLDQAIATVRARVLAHPEDAPHVIVGDVVADLDRLLAQVPADLPLAVFHSAVLAYVDAETRAEFEARMAALADRPAGFTWISNEAASVMPGVAARLAARPSTESRLTAAGDERAPVQQGVEQPGKADVAGRFVLAVDGEPRALTGPHGQSLAVL